MKIKQIFVFAMLLSSSVLCQSQDIKYVSYFPVPFALHEQLDIKTLSILGSRGGAQISAGSASNITGVFSVKDGFIAADSVYISSEQDSDPGIGDTPVNLTAGQAASTGSTPDYDSSVGAMGNIQITAFSGSALHSLEAYNNAVITGVKWGGRGGIGINAGNNINWPSQCSGFNLSWVDLKLQGSDHYRTYLTCGGSAGGGPGPGGCTCSGGVLPGNYQSCGDGRQRLCKTDCTWGSCVCPSPLIWNGTSCVSSQPCTCTNGKVPTGTYPNCNCQCPDSAKYWISNGSSGLCCSRPNAYIDSCGCSIPGCAQGPNGEPGGCTGNFHCSASCPTPGDYDVSAGSGGGECYPRVNTI